MSSITQIAPEIPPLTRVFTPSPDCTNPSAYTSTLWANDQYAYQLDSGVSKSSCYPTEYRSLQIDKSSYYSPGVCPLSYVYVATSTARGQGENAAVTTYAVCCPPGLHTWGDQFSCTQTVTEGGWLSFARTGSGATAFANPISVAWQEGDLDLFEPKSAPVLALRSAGITYPSSVSGGASVSVTGSTEITRTTGLVPGATGSSTGGPTASASSSPSADDGLSTGAAAGIGVAATVVGLAVIGLVAWLVLRRFKISRRERKSSLVAEEDRAPHYASAAPHIVEAEHRPIFEAPPEARRYEADSVALRAELDAGLYVPGPTEWSRDEKSAV